MQVRRRQHPTPSHVSDDVTAILAAEVRRLRRLQRNGGLETDDFKALMAIGAAMRELEGSRLDAVVAILGHRFRHRDVPDEVLNPLLDAMTGGKDKGK